ncbi:ABATE domain-containing protein [Mycobacterium sp. PS03-16]|uniref:CGNR zinc finger domain-containing protein n=1 Tax=Mycobacterium sp. PS03-16 TaxID=2559611 RepID=UPI001FD8562A|nr:CGNR zinc finger domain-containing protein [Mycobacterium sp. PS03-16]
MSFVFVSGNLALDLAGTRKWRRTEPEELLATPGDLSRWFAETGELTDGIAVGDDAFRSALTLREAVYRLASARLAGDRFAKSDLAVVNDLAARPGMRIELSARGVAKSGDAHAALADVARSAIEVLADDSVAMKECGRPTCTRIYLDRSRGARRTWCGMDECGNRVKAAAYRARKRAAADS